MSKKSFFLFLILALLAILTGILGWIGVTDFALPIWYAVVLIIVGIWGFIVSLKTKKKQNEDEQ
ncbi:MAG TPA: hypothetical protein GX392_07245 [Clostridiales bacterium]|nr:hypothetical protein [Clostridiales bacterium]